MGLLESLDSSIADLFGQWNGYSTALATALVVLVTYRIMSAAEPDAHPLLLARQSVPSAVRNEGESAVYRSQSAPHGMALNSGLNVKDPGAPKFSRGRDGDLRHVWLQAVSGSGDAAARGRLLTVLGSENVVEHKMDDINRQINIIGRYIAERGSIKVAIYLPNSLEHLVTLLACSFYPNLTAVLIPFDVSDSELISMLRRSAVDTVVAATGSFPLDAVVTAYPSLRQLIWVVDQGSRHMDWNHVPEGMGSAVNVTTWQDLLNDSPAAAGTELPAPDDNANAPGDIVSFWQDKQGELEEMVRFTQANLVSGIAGQIAAIPTRERLTQADLFLPVESLSNVHTMTLTLTALYCNASVAFNSVAGPSADLTLATQGVAPTVIVASPATLLRTHQESTRRLGGGLAKLSHSLATSTLAQRGVHGGGNILSAFAAGARPRVGNAPGKLRLVYVAERIGGDTPLLSSGVLSDLRVYTGARVVYALTAARVAGAVAQTALYDYRLTPGVKAHFGVPPSSVEIYLKDMGEHKTTDHVVEGEIVARGPCVSGGEAHLGVAAKFNDDNTLSYV
ncbi:AMP-dependent synthetase/ligase [Metarhizium album ARSEF 1941]|uniref:AMP-dependent synthetase/ligase n=1 Tax=Metarhizium album (strain ARSEF 1941) TaxID=1081103 RepID=A0A0B2X874_METAS|nr:AMP-dependent synthetase/ligase [Metarhizium album ARSEF 1941]KHO01506.1 AMP-dependent synthetase/ligase [Metarhizium album ARSEF 1941]